ncbi:hypothetical protein DFP72DRAFT_46583 [Ephemerocybe angulata]|uniref:Uncharacterized protein n=1 Tax=Ephemerocybe angulata TaxID=980116 RepID=A0A8H6LWU4_9AGAR|nr:hypothetical protein DFP72DRAFT_46583 [Tulosesus angulatus]
MGLHLAMGVMRGELGGKAVSNPCIGAHTAKNGARPRLLSSVAARGSLSNVARHTRVPMVSTLSVPTCSLRWHDGCFNGLHRLLGLVMEATTLQLSQLAGPEDRIICSVYPLAAPSAIAQRGRGPRLWTMAWKQNVRLRYAGHIVHTVYPLSCSTSIGINILISLYLPVLELIFIGGCAWGTAPAPGPVFQCRGSHLISTFPRSLRAQEGSQPGDD